MNIYFLFIFKLPDGTYAIVHIGSGEGGNPQNCNTSGRLALLFLCSLVRGTSRRYFVGLVDVSPLHKRNVANQQRVTSSFAGIVSLSVISHTEISSFFTFFPGSTIHVSSDLDGPW